MNQFIPKLNIELNSRLLISENQILLHGYTFKRCIDRERFQNARTQKPQDHTALRQDS